MKSILADAVEAYRRKVFLQKARGEYAALRQDKKAWEEMKEERRLWDATLSDGLSGV